MSTRIPAGNIVFLTCASARESWLSFELSSNCRQKGEKAGGRGSFLQSLKR